ncbi:hypothetical protein GUJ93_ZPchr0002g26483 [Zizania palustris]|uniref:Uncharacterized protein n=1 Tax=Zizania palustris TaxID=103762 RepID=A0A8J5S340_ZIZPA|nr:hypothetical protein GUJ93_ZPchr0002g26483 [Zizania palustris]
MLSWLAFAYSDGEVSAPRLLFFLRDATVASRHKGYFILGAAPGLLGCGSTTATRRLPAAAVGRVKQQDTLPPVVPHRRRLPAFVSATASPLSSPPPPALTPARSRQEAE